MKRAGTFGVMAMLAAAAAWGCGDDDAGKDAGLTTAPAGKALSRLTAAEMEGLCAQLLETVRDAASPQQQCVEAALAKAGSSAACESASKACVDDASYAEWNKVRCLRLTGDSAAGLPKFGCDTKVADVTACYAQVGRWLDGLRCSQAGDAPAIPTCLADLSDGDCKFGLSRLLSDSEAESDAGGRAPEPGATECRANGKAVDYDFGAGEACNTCAIKNCCASFDACEADADCACYWKCLGQTGMRDCRKDCGLSDYPADFVDHAACLTDHCASPCDVHD